jgi:hypothetical protein
MKNIINICEPKYGKSSESLRQDLATILYIDWTWTAHYTVYPAVKKEIFEILAAC